ncbi:MAG: hypothetical protein DHS20C18_09150 [Saprospiraceae bacterium]|nr:MAG: hypothetical protein DHS20C18_09150 [Saprospiraceae bacterium]
MKNPQNTTPIHYIFWEIGIGGIELGVNHFVNKYARQRKLYVYGLRAKENNLYDESKVKVGLGGLKKGNPYVNYFKYCRVHHKDNFHLLSAGPVILLLTLLAGVRRPIYHIHGTIYWKSKSQKIYLKAAWLLSWMLSGILGKITFIGNSRHSSGIFNKKVLPVHPELIYNGFEVSTFLEKKHLRTKLKRIVYIGRLNRGKNVHLVIQLFESIAKDYPEVELHLAGNGPLRSELEAQAQKSPYGDRIFFHGFIRDVASFYASADLFIFLSAYESFGNVLAEALLTGLPILTSNIPVFEEIHGGKKDFLLGDPNDYPTLEKNLAKAIRQFPELAQQAYSSSEYIREKFNIQKHLIEIERIYEKY